MKSVLANNDDVACVGKAKGNLVPALSVPTMMIHLCERDKIPERGEN